MLDKRVIVSANSQISLAGPASFDLRGRFDAIRDTFRSNLVRLGAATVIGQVIVAYASLSPSITPTPDGGSPMRLLLPYSAMMLGFLSSYWGLWKPEEIDDGAPYSPRRAALAERKRLITSLLPTIMGGIAMLIPMFLPSTAAIVFLILGFLVLFGLELGGRRIGMPPAGYRRLRSVVGVLAIVILLNVITVQVWDFSILF